MTPPFMETTETPITVTLADWKPLCSSEGEKRLKLDFEIPLSDEVLSIMHPSIRVASETLATLENGIPECPITYEFNDNIDIYTKSGKPFLSLPTSLIHKLVVFRSTNATADAKDRYLFFTTTVKMPDEKSDEKLVIWARQHHKGSVYIKALASQLELPTGEGEAV